MRKQLLFIVFILMTTIVSAQKVKFKKNKIFVDKKEFLTYEKGGVFGAIEYDLTEINSKKRIITLVSNDNGTHMNIDDDYTKIRFLTKGENAEIRGGNLKNAIRILLKNDVLRKDGTLDKSKVELFIKNYDENISQKTIQIRG